MIFFYPAGQAGYEGHQHRRLQHVETGNFRPVGEEDDVIRRHAFSMALFIIEREIVETLSTLCSRYVRTPLPAVPLCRLCLFRQAQPQHGVHFVILNMQHGTRPESFASRRIPGVQNSVGTTP